MRKIIVILCVLFLPIFVCAKHVTPEMALQVANAFVQKSAPASAPIHKAGKARSLVRKTNTFLDNQAFYLYESPSQEGYVIVSSDDATRPVLAYSESGRIDFDNMPDNLRWWLEEYSNQIKWAQQQGKTAAASIQEEWHKVAAGSSNIGNIVVSPMIKTSWDQGKYYNSECPTNILDYLLGEDGHVYAGCVACAMAQVMKYWNWPTTGYGSHTNNINKSYPNLSVNFGNTTYHWENMPNKLTSSSTSTQIKNVATLMYHCGVAIDMNYGFAGSEADPNNIPQALVGYFRYQPYVQNMQRNATSYFSWVMVLTNQLSKGRPVIYGGYPTGDKPGHSFVCDGYSSNGYFHFNFGWSGKGNDWFLLDALLPDPSVDGSGAGSCDYRFYQNAVFNMLPEGKDFELVQMVSDLKPSATMIDIEGTYKLTAEIGHMSQSSMTADFSAYLIDGNYNVIKTLSTIKNVSFNGIESKSLAFEVKGIDVEEGVYYVIVKYKKDGKTKDVGCDYYANLVPLQITKEFKLTPGKYAIVASRAKETDKNWFYMSAVKDGTKDRFQAINTEKTDINAVNLKDLPDDYIWELVADGSNWKLKNGSQYVSWTSNNTAKLDATGKSLTFNIAENQVEAYFNDGTADRYLSLNATTGNNFFAFYGNKGQITYLYFLPIEEDKPTPPTPSNNEYYIVAKRSTGNYYFFTPDKVSGKERLIAVDAGTDIRSMIDTISTTNDYLWTLEDSSTGKLLKNHNGSYLTCAAAKSAKMADSGTVLNLTNNSDGTVTFSYAADASTTHYLSLATAGNDYFVFYANTNQTTHLLLLPKGNGVATEVDHTIMIPQCTKIMQDGKVYIKRDGVLYNVMGERIR